MYPTLSLVLINAPATLADVFPLSVSKSGEVVGPVEGLQLPGASNWGSAASALVDFPGAHCVQGTWGHSEQGKEEKLKSRNS